MPAPMMATVVFVSMVGAIVPVVALRMVSAAPVLGSQAIVSENRTIIAVKADKDLLSPYRAATRVITACVNSTVPDPTTSCLGRHR